MNIDIFSVIGLFIMIWAWRMKSYHPIKLCFSDFYYSMFRLGL